MKKSEIKQLSSKSKKELDKILRELREEIAKLVLERNAPKSKNTAVLGQKKKEIARILTFLCQKEP